MPPVSHMELLENRKIVAALYTDGQTRDVIASEFNVHVDTVTTWIQRPDVQALITKMQEERANRIMRKVDKAIEGRLQHVEKMDIETLLKVRKEFVPDRNASQIKEDPAGAAEDLIRELHENPEAARVLLGPAALEPGLEEDEDELPEH